MFMVVTSPAYGQFMLTKPYERDCGGYKKGHERRSSHDGLLDPKIPC